MPTDILHQEGTPTVFSDTTDYSSTASGLTRTDQLDLTSLASAAARQSTKADLGAVRATLYAVRVGIEFAVAPVAAVEVEIYWSPSFSATAGTGNDAGASGADGAYKAGEEAEWLKQAQFLGSLVATADATTTVQYQTVGYFTPPHRYGQVIVFNRGGQALVADAVEMYVALIPVITEIQN
jgi:hypothetical protein